MTPFTTQTKARIQAQLQAQAQAQARAREKAAKPPSGVQLIAAERDRQITEKGWTAQSDADFDSGELVLAGVAYALASISDLAEEASPSLVRRLFPWSDDRWNPKGLVQNLVRAASLLAAEIDRILRQGEDPELRLGGAAEAWKAAGLKPRTPARPRIQDNEEEMEVLP